MLALLLEKYKQHRPTLNYFRPDDHECADRGDPSGWHCTIHKTPRPHIMSDSEIDNLISVGGFETPTDALLAVIHML